MNPLSNAVTYTPPNGEIHEVRDSGDGIAPEDLSRILGLFARAGDHHEGGFGIGLAVARSLGKHDRCFVRCRERLARARRRRALRTFQESSAIPSF
jgi:K+-sensing histidine kinase KdpD